MKAMSGMGRPLGGPTAETVGTALLLLLPGPELRGPELLEEELAGGVGSTAGVVVTGGPEELLLVLVEEAVVVVVGALLLRVGVPGAPLVVLSGSGSASSSGAVASSSGSGLLTVLVVGASGWFAVPVT